MVAAGGAEGQLIAGARINALRTALSGLVTTDNADVRFLPDVPPGLTALGIDGVLLTGGVVASTQPSARCVRILRTDREMASTRSPKARGATSIRCVSGGRDSTR
jgi:hypothetical protein